MTAVDFYFGLGSRYSYLAATRIADLAAETGARFRWRPLFSGELLRRLGRSPFEGAPLSGQYDWSYRQLDAERWADLYGVPFVEPPPFALPPVRYALAAEAARRDGRVGAMSLALFRSIFAAGAPAGAPEIAAAATAAGLDPDAHAVAMADADTAAAVEATVVEALAAGVFGVPTWVVDGDLYWGNDRLPLLRRRLLQGTKK